MGIDPVTLGLIVLGGGAFYAGSQLFKGSKKREEPAAPGAAIVAPSEAEATPEQKARIRKKTRTILTSPLTGAEEFGIAPPTLLGSGDVTKKRTVG